MFDRHSYSTTCRQNVGNHSNRLKLQKQQENFLKFRIRCDAVKPPLVVSPKALTKLSDFIHIETLCCSSLITLFFVEFLFWIHLVWQGLFPRCLLTSNRPDRKNIEPQHNHDVQGSAGPSAAQLFINCRRGGSVYYSTCFNYTELQRDNTPIPPVLARTRPLSPMKVFSMRSKLLCEVP